MSKAEPTAINAHEDVALFCDEAVDLEGAEEVANTFAGPKRQKDLTNFEL